MPQQMPRLPVKNLRVKAKGTTTERGYGWEHQKACKRKLQRNPICELCNEKLATDVHHLDRNPFNRADANLQSLCEPCHHGIAHKS